MLFTMFLCPVTPSRPQANPSCSDTSSVRSPVFPGQVGGGARISLHLPHASPGQCFYLGRSIHPLYCYLLLPVLFLAASEIVNSCRAGAPSVHLCATAESALKAGEGSVY